MMNKAYHGKAYHDKAYHDDAGAYHVGAYHEEAYFEEAYFEKAYHEESCHDGAYNEESCHNEAYEESYHECSVMAGVPPALLAMLLPDPRKHCKRKWEDSEPAEKKQDAKRYHITMDKPQTNLIIPPTCMECTD